MIFKNIKLNSKFGFIVWSITVVLVWIAIFVIGAGVPQVNAVSAFTSSLTMIPLTYVIPFLTHLASLYRLANATYV